MLTIEASILALISVESVKIKRKIRPCDDKRKKRIHERAVSFLLSPVKIQGNFLATADTEIKFIACFRLRWFRNEGI